jgi:MerR family transcriptional regulator, thiopeptide resistance regulator
MEWSIQEIAKLAGTTSRTLRHYDETGLVPPSRIGANGYRYYDADALVRLQRVLLLRGLGLGIPAIAQVLDGQRDDEHALVAHLGWLRAEQLRLDRQIASVESTINSLRGGEKPMAENMFDGFDHTAFKDEVQERWGETAYADSDAWWRGLSNAQKVDVQDASVSLVFDWTAAAERGLDPAGDEAQALARRQFEFLAGIPGVPRGATGPSREYYTGLGEMYVADPRFAKNYGGVAGATFVRDAMQVFAATNL